MSGSVGIFFVWNDGLLIESTDLQAAMPYGAMWTHEGGHPDFWEKLRNDYLVPRDIDYDAVPRGRVTFDTQRQVYYLFVDKCIRDRPEMISKIISILGLPPPPATQVRLDQHYRCFGCGYFEEL